MLAATTYTLRDQLGDVDTAGRTLQRLRESGCTTVQVSGFRGLKGEQIAELLRAADLTVCGAHVQYPELRDDLPRVLEDLAAWDCTDVSVPSPPPDFRSAEGVVRLAPLLDELGARLLEHGVRLTYHNHSLELQRLPDGRTALEALYAATDPVRVQAELDTYWIQHGGGDPAAWIRRFAGRLPLLHVKDMGMLDNKQVDLPAGDGNFDWDAILGAARSSGVEWLIVEQDNPTGDPVECVARSLRFLQRRLAA
ncbi:MAG TPA: sugar phosphate isomerase/epimerase [Candidatus Dormibacteraeota bacterium]